MDSARIVWEVSAGMIPGQRDESFTRRYTVTSAEWEARDDRLELLLTRHAQATGYASKLILDSANGLAPNWVRLDYIWL